MKKDVKRGQLNVSFGWIFALIVGAVILFLTIYGVTNFINTSQQQQTSAEAQELQILLNPLQTSFSSAVSTYIERNTPTRIHNECLLDGEFGEQGIRVSEESVGGWTDAGIQSRFENKYIFSNSTVQGQTFYIFSMPFEFPYKVSDLIFLTSADKEYCFNNPPEEVESDLWGSEGLDQANLVLGCDSSNEDQIEVCFESSDCDVNVDYDEGSGSVEKDGEEAFFYSDALMYGAVFSDKDTYECQVGRLFKRTSNLASVYIDKHDHMERTSCQTNFRSDLSVLQSRLDGSLDGENEEVSGLLSSSGFTEQGVVESLAEKNENSFCSLW